MKQTLQVVFSLFCLLPLALEAAAQTEDQVRDVQKLYKTAQVPGLEVTVYLQEKNGSLVPVEPQRQFHQGERVKVRIESNVRGYLYIVNHGSSGNKMLIFPDSKESNQIQPGIAYLFPKTYELAFDDKAGFETIQVIVAGQRLPWLDAALKQPDNRLNAKQVTAVQSYWNTSTPEAGVSTGAADLQSGPYERSFDEKRGTTTILLDGSRDPAFRKRPPAPKPRRRISGPPLSVGIQLWNIGTPQ